MFKNIQKQLLLKYPLLWNTKFVPLLAIGIIIHIIFFGLGYVEGSIDFSNQTEIVIEFSAIMFGVMAILIVFIIWVINYLKNNALKSFYSKSKHALFFEWIQIFTISFFLISFYIPFSIGKQLHQRSYYSLEETTKRCEVISMSDVFLDGSFAQTEIDSVASSQIDSTENYNAGNRNMSAKDVADAINYGNAIYKDHILFRGKKYSEFSLLNRNTYAFSVISEEKDSLNQLKIKNWLADNNDFEVKKLMKNYFFILKEHHLKTNFEINKWFDIVYKAPNFNSFLYITPYYNEYETDDSYSNYATAVAPNTSYNDRAYSKYYVQQNILKNNYDIVSNAYTNSFINYEMLLGFLYGAFGISILLFSFRVTSGKSWLISLILIGVVNVVYGIFTAVLGFGYPYLVLLTFFGVFTYFIAIYMTKTSLKYSRVALNLVLWSFAGFIPMVYFLIQEYYSSYRYDYNDYNSPEYDWLSEHTDEMFVVNFIIIILVMFVLSQIIRNWKAIAEE